MQLKSKSLAVAAAALAVVVGSTSAHAVTCAVSMPVGGANAAILSVLAASYPGVPVVAPTATTPGSASVPNCNPADFANAGANVSQATGGAGAGVGAAGALGTAGIVGAVVVVAAIAAIAGSGGGASGTTTTTTGTGVGN